MCLRQTKKQKQFSQSLTQPLKTSQETITNTGAFSTTIMTLMHILFLFLWEYRKDYLHSCYPHPHTFPANRDITIPVPVQRNHFAQHDSVKSWAGISKAVMRLEPYICKTLVSPYWKSIVQKHSDICHCKFFFNKNSWLLTHTNDYYADTE